MSQRQVNTRTLCASALVLACVSIGAPVAQAASGCDFESPTFDASARQLDYTIGADGLDFTSRSSVTPKEVLRGSFDLDAARLLLQLEGADATAPVRLMIEYAAAVEFRDMDGDARLGFGDDIVREFPLADSPGATLQSVPRIRPASHEALARYPLNGSNLLGGVLEIRFLVLSQSETVSGEARAPGRVFTEVAVDSFPFMRNDTRFALRVRQQSSAELNAGADEILAEGDAGRLSYRWSRCVVQASGTSPVGPVVLEYPSGASPRTTTVFAFPYGERIQHATSVGIAPPPVAKESFDVTTLLPSGNWLIFGLAAVGAGVAIVSTAWRRLRGA